MAFTDSIRALPFTPRTQNGSGFFAPMARAIGHIEYALGCLAEEQMPKTDEDILGELRHAQEHWNARTASEAVSTVSRERATLIATALGEAITEFPGWNAESRLANLRDLVHRTLQYCADLDRELVGIRGSDPGTSL